MYPSFKNFVKGSVFTIDTTINTELTGRCAAFNEELVQYRVSDAALLTERAQHIPREYKSPKIYY